MRGGGVVEHGRLELEPLLQLKDKLRLFASLNHSFWQGHGIQAVEDCQLSIKEVGVAHHFQDHLLVVLLH